jgi:hypothetical protein
MKITFIKNQKNYYYLIEKHFDLYIKTYFEIHQTKKTQLTIIFRIPNLQISFLILNKLKIHNIINQIVY